MKPIQIPPGVFDLLPHSPKDAWRNSHLWQYVEGIIRQTARDYCFQEIRTPIFERTDLFVRSVGKTSDIVSKEMYTFEDRGGRSMTLRPEGTASVIRAFIDNQMDQQRSIHRLFYLGPMFRYERSQAGRYRQHHQFGVEVIGIPAPEQDGELIDMAYTLYTRLGLKNLSIQLNSLGSSESRGKYREALLNYLEKYLPDLSEESQTRFQTNPLRILDSKSPTDQQILQGAPSILDHLDDLSKSNFQRVQAYLDQLDIPYTINPSLVRGLDYYNQTVFEVTASELGAQNSIGGGGRFDGLISSLGGPDLPSTGFATGFERIIQTLLKQNAPSPSPQTPMLFLIPLGEQAKEICFSFTKTLRERGIAVEVDLSNRKLNKVMQYANQIQARYVAVIGDQELETRTVSLKEMATGRTTQAPLLHLGRILQVEQKSDSFTSLWKEMTEPFSEKEEADYFIQRLTRNIDETKKVTKQLQDAVETINTYLM